MVLQIVAHRRPVDAGRNSVASQQRARPDPRQLQQLGGIDRACAHDDLAARVNLVCAAAKAEFHARRARAIHEDTRGMRLGEQCQEVVAYPG